MTAPGFAPKAPGGLVGRVMVTISGYTGWDQFLYLMPRWWQASSCAARVKRTYHAAGFPAQGVALQLPCGDWYRVDLGPSGRLIVEKAT